MPIEIRFQAFLLLSSCEQMRQPVYSAIPSGSQADSMARILMPRRIDRASHSKVRPSVKISKPSVDCYFLRTMRTAPTARLSQPMKDLKQRRLLGEGEVGSPIQHKSFTPIECMRFRLNISFMAGWCCRVFDW